MKTNQKERSSSFLPANLRGQEKNTKTSTRTFKVGAVALAFFIIGFEVSLFVGRVAVLRAQEPASGQPVAAGQKGAGGVDRHSNFRFDPNTVSFEDLQRLGFSARQAQSIISYREKGGRFYRKSDFAKSFVVADSVYRRLEPYIDIPLVDINAADSAAFDALPGIGPFYASKMVQYRAQLGKYTRCEQLMDIWKFDSVKFASLRDLICCNGGVALDLMSVPEDSLARHPAVRSRSAAHGIVLYRESHETVTPAALYEAGVLDSVQFVRLSRTQ